MVDIARVLDSWTSGLERASRLDPVADKIAGAYGRLSAPGAVKNALSGTWLGHPLHPLLVSIPIGAWTSAAVLDLQGRQPQAARRLVGLGLLSAAAAAAAGGSDYADTSDAERRVGLVHWASALTSASLYGLSWARRRRGGSGRIPAFAGAAVMAATGYLGGHLSYALGVGVDTTAFETGPQDWTEVAAADEVREGEPLQVTADGVAIVLLRRGGTVHALADRCTHRGGPLSDGELSDGCLVCPWHGSRFDITDGSVRRGPAVRPQPTYEVQESAGRLLIRRSEERALRSNPA